MAEKRMFSRSVIESDGFLDMPLSAQALYFHLAMRADDDGFVTNPKSISRVIGAAEDDLKLLIAKNYVLAFENGVIVISHWRVHNYIPKDRYHGSLRPEKELVQLDENSRVYRLYTGRIQDVYKMYTESSIDKNRLDKSSSSIESYLQSKGTTTTTITELKNLIGEERLGHYIRVIRNWERMHKTVSDPEGLIRKWYAEDAKKLADRESSYDLDKFEEFAKNLDLSKVSG